MSRTESYISVLHNVSEREQLWFKKVDKAVLSHNRAAYMIQQIGALLFDRAVPANLPVSNQHVRNASRLAFMDTVISHRHADPSTQLFLATFGGVRGQTSLSAPTIDLVTFQRSVYALLRRNGLTGFFSFEFDVVLRRSPLEDHTVLFHCHGVVQPIQPAAVSDLRELPKKLLDSNAFPPWDEAPGVDIRPIGRAEMDACRVAAYLFDPFHQLKRVQPRRRDPQRRMMRSTRDKLTPALVLRAAEIQSHLSVFDTVFGVGECGASMRRAWRARLKANLPAQAAQSEKLLPNEVGELWRRIRTQDGSTSLYGPVRVATRSGMLRARATT